MLAQARLFLRFQTREPRAWTKQRARACHTIAWSALIDDQISGKIVVHIDLMGVQ